MDGRRRASERVDHDDPRPSWSQGGKREVSPRVFCRSGKQPSRETREDPVPVRRRAEVKAEAITHVHGDVPARIGKVERGPSFVAGSGNFVAGSGTSVDRGFGI